MTPHLPSSLQSSTLSYGPATATTKYCSKCGKNLPLSNFSRDRNTPSGLKYWCRSCRSKDNCNRSDKRKNAFNKITSAAVYFIANEYKPEHIKIGFTASFSNRFRDHFCSTSGKILLLALIQAKTSETEFTLHQQFKHLRIDQYSEWFLAKESLLSYLSTLDQSLAHQSIASFTAPQKSRVIIPPIPSYIDQLPFL